MLVTAGGWLLLAEREQLARGPLARRRPRHRVERRDTRAARRAGDDRRAGVRRQPAPRRRRHHAAADLLDDSVKHAVGVSKDLRDGVRESIELLATEVLRRRRARGLPSDVDGLAADLTRQSLRYLYRILFLLYAEARPELGVLPVGVPEYAEGYGLDRLRELVLTDARPATPPRNRTHLYQSLGMLFRLVNDGYPPETLGPDGVAAAAPSTTGRAAVRGAARRPVLPDATALIDEVGLGDGCLQAVLGRLLLTKKQRGRDARVRLLRPARASTSSAPCTRA